MVRNAQVRGAVIWNKYTLPPAGSRASRRARFTLLINQNSDQPIALYFSTAREYNIALEAVYGRGDKSCL